MISSSRNLNLILAAFDLGQVYLEILATNRNLGQVL